MDKLSNRVMALEGPDRFYDKVEISENCWLWTGAKRGSRQKRGYFWNGEKNVDAARWHYQQLNPDAVMDGMVVMHTCDNPLCVRPDHLTLGTQADNVADMHSKRRSHQHRDPAVGKMAANKANALMAVEPSRRPRGQRHGLAKLTDEQRRFIGQSNEPTSHLASTYGVHPTTIQRVRAAALKARGL